MAEPRLYENFDLSIERGRYGYKVRLLASPAGEASARFRRPFHDIDKLLRDLSSADRELDQPAVSSKRVTPESVGARLFRSLFTGAVRERWAASSAGGRPLRIRLRLLPELEDWPWELLYDPDRRVFLAQSTVTPVVRYLEVGGSPPPLQVQPPVRILVVAVGSCGGNALDIEREWNILRQALSDPARVSLDRLDPQTPTALQRKLQQQAYHILHFIGHGSFDQGEGVIELEGEDRRTIRLTGQRLATILGDQQELRLVVLNSCSGARTSGRDPFSGVAQSLVTAGLPAVIAMRTRISDQAAIVWSRHFYGALASGDPVDQALSTARWAVHAEVAGLAWSTPVLHMRSPDGRIFEVASEEPRTKERVETGVDFITRSLSRSRSVWITAAVLGVLAIGIWIWTLLPRSMPISDPGCPSPPDLNMPFARISEGNVSVPDPNGENKILRVRIDQPFCFGKIEVTQSQWKALGFTNPSRHKDGDRPVEKVSWFDGQQLVAKLNELDPAGHYRLPSENEWQRAAEVGGTPDPEEMHRFGNCMGEDGFEKTAPVASFKPNRLGIYDVFGNVSEWTRDWFLPTGGGPTNEKLHLGGSFENTAKNCASHYRSGSLPTRHSEDIGLRIVRDVVK